MGSSPTWYENEPENGLGMGLSYCLYSINFLHRKQVEASLEEAQKDGVRVPQTLEEYTAMVQKRLIHSTSSNDIDDAMDYDYTVSSDDDEEIDDEDTVESEEELQGEEDSGMA